MLRVRTAQSDSVDAAVGVIGVEADWQVKAGNPNRVVTDGQHRLVNQTVAKVINGVVMALQQRTFVMRLLFLHHFVAAGVVAYGLFAMLLAQQLQGSLR